jgi:hypothetical protein
MKKLLIGLALTLSSISAFACGENGVCQYDRVNFGDYVGTAKEVFSNGKVKIKVDGYAGHTYRTTSELGKGVNCFKEICEGNRVNFDDYVGTAKEVFSNGRVKIKVDGYDGYSFRTANQLGYEIDCSSSSQNGCNCTD